MFQELKPYMFMNCPYCSNLLIKDPNSFSIYNCNNHKDCCVSIVIYSDGSFNIVCVSFSNKNYRVSLDYKRNVTLIFKTPYSIINGKKVPSPFFKSPIKEFNHILNINPENFLQKLQTVLTFS